ncbi:MAG: hypothetical protein ACT4NY_14425 [Pseudonocardiales bacterium]
MPDTRILTHVDTLRLPVTQPFHFRYTLWKPSHFATGLEQHSQRGVGARSASANWCAVWC